MRPRGGDAGKIDEGEETAASRDAWLGEAVEDVEAHVPARAIGRGWLGTPAMARRR